MKSELAEFLTHPVIAAAAGALVGLRALPGASYPEKLTNLAAGFAIAVWGGPALVDWLAIGNPNIASGAIFACGATGLVVANAVWEGIRRTDLAAWLAAFLPARKGGDQ